MSKTILFAIVTILLVIGIVVGVKYAINFHKQTTTTSPVSSQNFSSNAKYHGNPHFRFHQ